MINESFITKVDGMICPQCEDEIAHRLLYSRGIISCDSSYRKSQVSVVYDPDIISQDEITKILTDTGYPVGDGRSALRADLIAFIAVICLYFLIPALTGLVKVPTAESGSGFGALFIIGVLTGVHCIGMCGGIMLSQQNVPVYNGRQSLGYSDSRPLAYSGSRPLAYSDSRPLGYNGRRALGYNTFLYNGGRLLSYTIVGAICGAIGRMFSYDAELKSVLFTICGLLVVLIGLRMWGVPILRKLSPEPVKPCRFNFNGRAFVVGLLTGLMPCGALSSMWILSASSGSWQSGATAMLAFGLGTCVFMLAFGLFGIFIPKKYNKYLMKCSTVLIVAMGLILMTKGLRIL